MTTAAEAVPTNLYLKPLAAIVASKRNPRKIFRDMDQLAASVKQHGVLEPPTVRPLDGGEFELVKGERRYRAAKLAGLEAIPVFVRTLSDDEAYDLMSIENAQRADLHPLEEAENFEELHKRKTVDEIAAMVGKSRASVYKRMTLLSLGKEARKAFLDDKISASVAELLARIPVPKLQAEALADCIGRHGNAPLAFREASGVVQNRYMLTLANAPFDRNDDELVAGVPSCARCPKRTGNQAELFGDVASKDMCTDPPCFQMKRDASWEKTQAAAKAKGRTVLAAKETKEIFPFGGTQISRTAGYVDLDAKEYDAKGAQRTLRSRLGKHLPKDAIVVARAPDGTTRELLTKAHVAKASKAAGILPKKERATDTSSERFKEQQQKQKLKRETLEAIAHAVLDKVVTAAIARPGDDALSRVMASALIKRAEFEQLERIEKRLGLAKDKKSGTMQFVKSIKSIEPLVAKMKGAELRGLVVELLAGDEFFNIYDKLPEGLLAFADLYRVNAKQVEADIVAQHKVQATLKAAEKKVDAKDKAKKKGGGK